MLRGMRLSSFLLISCVAIAACSTAATQNDSGSTASASGTDSSATQGPVTSSGEHGTTTPDSNGTTSSPTTGLTTTEDATGAPHTSTSGPTSITDGETTSVTTDTSTTDATDTDTTTGGSGGACEVDADCKLHDDCCSCYAIPVDQEDEACDLQCLQSKCSELGIKKAMCVLGQCTTEKIDCSSPVACDSKPPACPPGTVPGVSGACWSGACVPAEACDKVPSCDYCPESTLCVANQAFTTEFTCTPRPAACGDQVDCKCAGEACVDPFTACNEGEGEIDLICGCPTC
jgi:hypothetical protein